MVYINSHLLGVGDEALGSILMRAFLKTLLELERPTRLILINSGVRLASEGSEVLETLRALSEKGVEILSCGTCLDFYGLKEKLKVGIVSNMYDIAQITAGSRSVNQTMTCVFIFNSIHRVMKAEKLLKGRGLPVDLIPVPREISSDCGVAIEMPAEIGEEALSLMDENRIAILECYIRHNGKFEKRTGVSPCG